MTDSELRRVCAEAMGYMLEWRETPFTPRGTKVLYAGPYDAPRSIYPYDPLTNYAQNAALDKVLLAMGRRYCVVRNLFTLFDEDYRLIYENAGGLGPMLDSSVLMRARCDAVAVIGSGRDSQA